MKVYSSPSRIWNKHTRHILQILPIIQGKQRPPTPNQWCTQQKNVHKKMWLWMVYSICAAQGSWRIKYIERTGGCIDKNHGYLSLIYINGYEPSPYNMTLEKPSGTATHTISMRRLENLSKGWVSMVPFQIIMSDHIWNKCFPKTG